MTTNRIVNVDGHNIFVREAGDRSAPAIVLLHGFPSSSHMFRGLIPRLAEHFHVIAPDMVGFGHSDAPSVDAFDYTFDHLASVTRKLLARMEVDSYVLYLHDYGGPVGFRLAAAAPEKVRGLVVQNANAYMEGVSEAVAGLFMPLWKEQNAQTLGAARGFLTAAATKGQYTTGAKDPASLDPTAWLVDQALLDRPGVSEAQLALFVDYQSNVALYDTWHAYLRQHQPKTLVVWGKNDPFFLVAGAEAYARDVPSAEIVLLDGGHFALEEHAGAIAARITRAFAPKSPQQIVTAFYEALGKGTLDEALGLLTADVRWNDPVGFPYGGALTGPGEVRAQIFERIFADWAPFAIEVTRVAPLDDGESVVAIGRYAGTAKASGRTMKSPFVHVWRARGARLARFETHCDTKAIHDALGA